MWKKLNDPQGAQPESASQRVPESLESLDKSLTAAFLESQSAKDFAVPSQMSSADDRPSTAATMATYAAAMNEFTENATAFIGYLPLLAKARDAYERGMRVSAELRKGLDAGEDSLRVLMNQLEQAVKSTADRKKVEPAKVESIRETDKAS